MSKTQKIDLKKLGNPPLSKKQKETTKKKSKKTKIGPPTLFDSSKSSVDAVMAILAGSSILSALTEGHASPPKVALVTQTGSKLSHNVFDKSRGWIRQASKPKPMIIVQSRVDLSAYAALHISPPSQSI